MKLFFKPILFVAALLDVVQVSADKDVAELRKLVEDYFAAEEIGTAPVVPPTDAPVVPPTAAPVVPPTAAPVVPPTAAPVVVVPLTDAPVVPPTDAPVVPLTDAPVVPPTDAPVVPPTAAPVVPLTDAPVVPPTAAPVVLLTDAPVVPPTDAPVVPPTAAPVAPQTEGDGFFAADQPAEDSGQDAPTEEDVFEEPIDTINLARAFYETNCDGHRAGIERHVNQLLEFFDDEMLVNSFCSEEERGRIMEQEASFEAAIAAEPDESIHKLFEDWRLFHEKEKALVVACDIAYGIDMIEHFDKIALALESVDTCKAELTNELGMLRMGEKPQYSIIALQIK